MSRKDIADLVIGAAIFLVPLTAIMVLIGVDRWTARRVGRVSFQEDGRIEIRKGSQLHATSFADLAGYRDGSNDFIELVPKPGTAAVPLELRTVPTITEANRTRVLALLDERGVRRLD